MEKRKLILVSRHEIDANLLKKVSTIVDEDGENYSIFLLKESYRGINHYLVRRASTDLMDVAFLDGKIIGLDVRDCDLDAKTIIGLSHCLRVFLKRETKYPNESVEVCLENCLMIEIKGSFNQHAKNLLHITRFESTSEGDYIYNSFI